MARRRVPQHRQRLVMTPLLEQAIQLLQRSTLALERVVRTELEGNPLREEMPDEKEAMDDPRPCARSESRWAD